MISYYHIAAKIKKDGIVAVNDYCALISLKKCDD